MSLRKISLTILLWKMTDASMKLWSHLMYFRRNSRQIIAIVLFIFVVHLLYKSTSLSANVSTRTIKSSSYDWSRWQPFHPVESITPLPTTKPRRLASIQDRTRPFKFDVQLQQQRCRRIKQVMAKCWQNYVEHAWLYDELTPLSGEGKDTFGGWAASAIDSLDTLFIMGMKDEFEMAVDGALTLDWANYTGGSACNMFETTIRYLGGLLSAYDLSNERALLDKAIQLGDMLYAGFDTPNHMPGFWFDFEKAKSGNLLADEHQAAASITLQMEFAHLAQLTGNNKYYDAVARVTDKLFEAQNKTNVPGMWPTFFELRSGNFTADKSFTLGALSDSMYEYVLKTYLVLGGTEPKYEVMYRQAADAIIEHLLFRPMTPDNLNILFSGTYLSEGGGKGRLEPIGQHLACFAGGMFAIGGKIFGIPEHIDIAERLTRGCIWAYEASVNGIAPEIFKLVLCETIDGCAWEEQKWMDAKGSNDVPEGFQSVDDARYILRPEALESVFILFRITGKDEYREAAWRMFESIQKATETQYGNAAIADMTAAQMTQVDSMESFWLAESLKYLYLTFSPSDTVSLDDFVFNTEAHPFKILK